MPNTTNNRPLGVGLNSKGKATSLTELSSIEVSSLSVVSDFTAGTASFTSISATTYVNYPDLNTDSSGPLSGYVESNSLSGYAQTSALSSYAPLSGAPFTGAVTAPSVSSTTTSSITATATTVSATTITAGTELVIPSTSVGASFGAIYFNGTTLYVNDGEGWILVGPPAG